MLKKRLIACLDVADGRVVKGVRFRGHEDVGDILELAQRYSEQGIDELVFYDITASPEQRGVAPAWIESVARRINIPFCVAGGIRSIAQADQVLALGADKVSINTPALENPDLISELAKRFGSQCVVIGSGTAGGRGPTLSQEVPSTTAASGPPSRPPRYPRR